MAWYEAYEEYDTRPCHDLGAGVLRLDVFIFLSYMKRILYEHVYSCFHKLRRTLATFPGRFSAVPSRCKWYVWALEQS